MIEKKDVKSKTLAVRLKPKVYRDLKKLADEDGRNVSSFVTVNLLKIIEEEKDKIRKIKKLTKNNNDEIVIRKRRRK